MNYRIILGVLVITFSIGISIFFGVEFLNTTEYADYIPFTEEQENYLDQNGFSKKRESFDVVYENDIGIRIENSGNVLVVSGPYAEINGNILFPRYYDDGNKYFVFEIMTNDDVENDLENGYQIITNSSDFNKEDLNIIDSEINSAIDQFRNQILPIINYDFGYQPTESELDQQVKVLETVLEPATSDNFLHVRTSSDGIQLFQKENYQVEVQPTDNQAVYSLSIFDRGNEIGTLDRNGDTEWYTAIFQSEEYTIQIISYHVDTKYSFLQSEIQDETTAIYHQLQTAGLDFEQFYYSE